MFSKKVWLTQHSGKLKGINSINTSCRINPICKKRAENKNSICHYCYAERYLKCRSSLEKHLIDNFKELTSHILNNNELPKLNTNPFRFESFGDIANDIQLINYINTASANSDKNVALWTKNINILYNVFIKMGYKKPTNMFIIVSSPYLNKPVDIPTVLLPYIDKRFTVYESEYAESNDIVINCGGRSCKGCMLCYTQNDVFDINELKK